MSAAETAAREAAAWNALHPAAVLVQYWKGVRRGEPSGTAHTRSRASVVGDSAVVWIEGVAGCIALSHVAEVTPLAAALAASATAYRVYDPDVRFARGHVRSGGYWSAWCARCVVASTFDPAPPHATEYATKLIGGYAAGVKGALAIDTQAVDREALAAWLAALPAPAYNDQGRALVRVRLAGHPLDPGVLVTVVPLVATGGPVSVGAGEVGKGCEVVTLRGASWLWCGATLMDAGEPIATAFSTPEGGAS
jgi:hypothetical protein